jgi:hypothetical protein
MGALSRCKTCSLASAYVPALLERDGLKGLSKTPEVVD